jgi:Protein of unknown function (DUF2933)
MRQLSKDVREPLRLHLLSAVLLGLAIAGLVIVVFQHWMHVWLWLPYVLVLACPLMMFFMMRGMHEPKL